MRAAYRLVFVTVLLAGAIAVSALASGSARRVVGDCTKSQVRPSSIVLACADDNLVLTHLHWSSFGASDATAAGDYYVNGCTPDCAAGKFHSYPIKLTLSAARECPDGHLHCLRNPPHRERRARHHLRQRRDGHDQRHRRRGDRCPV